MAIYLLLALPTYGQTQSSTAPSAQILHGGVSKLPGQAPLVLVGPNVPAVPIVIRKDAPNHERQAAQELAKYLEQMSGVKCPVLPGPGEVPERAVLVGPVDFTPPGGLTREGFLIRTEGTRLRICGGSPEATRMGVLALLEEQLGCRWWARDAELVPASKTIEVAAQDTHIEPAFRQHDLFNREAQSDENGFRFKRRTVSLVSFTGGHTLCPLLKPYAEQNPDFLPMDKQGKRAFNNVHMNYAAPGISEAVAEVLEKEYGKRGRVEDLIFMAGMGDWYGGMDLSPESRKIYEEETWTDPDGVVKPGYSATLLRMVNKTAELLEAKHPGLTMGTFAYMSLEAPPSRTLPRANVAIQVPRLRHVTVRSILEADEKVAAKDIEGPSQNIDPTDAPGRGGAPEVSNRSFRRNLERWVQLAPGRVYVWEYGTNFTHMAKPFPCLRSIAENIKLYHKVGVTGVMVQGPYIATGGDLAAIKNYVWSRLLWNPALDAEVLIKEFCQGYYGPAADEMLAYVNLMENSVRGERPSVADEFDTRWAYLTPEVVRKGQGLLVKALAKTGGSDADPCYRRVKEAQVSIEAFLLWPNKPPKDALRESGEMLVHAEYGEEGLKRAQDVVKYCREVSPREWGTGLSYRLEFLSWFGGPMPVLRQGELTVKVAPSQRGQIRAVLYQGRPAIDESHVVPRADGKDQRGFYALSKREGNRVEMTGDAASSWLHPFALARSVEVDAEGVIRTRDVARTLASVGGKPPAGNERMAGSIIETSYLLVDKPDAVRVEFQDEKGQWQPVPMPAGQKTSPIPLAKRLRITRSDQRLVIDDRYLAVGAVTGAVAYDQAANTLKTRVDMGEVKVGKQESVDLARREIRIAPAPQAAP